MKPPVRVCLIWGTQYISQSLGSHFIRSHIVIQALAGLSPTDGDSVRLFAMSLASYIRELRSLPPEIPLEPEFKDQDRQKQDKKIR